MIRIALLLLLAVPLISFSQAGDITVVNKSNNKAIAGVQILSKNGSLLTSSNAKGKVNREMLIQTEATGIVIYDADYKIVEFKINDIPDIIYLTARDIDQLEDVVINAQKKDKKYFKIRGYARSWQLSNDSLVKYGDAIIEYLIPYEHTGNDFIPSIKKEITAYRTFNTDSTKQKPWGLVISGYDPYFQVNIPKRDILARQSYKDFNIAMNADSLFQIFSEGKNVGNVLYDNTNNPIKISLTENTEGEEEIKNMFFKFSSSTNDIEKWIGEGNERHVSYLFSSDKKIMVSKLESTVLETVNELFIDDVIIYIIKKPKNSRKHINQYVSYYNDDFWTDELKKHPLPTFIQSQLVRANEYRNTFKF